MAAFAVVCVVMAMGLLASVAVSCGGRGVVVGLPLCGCAVAAAVLAAFRCFCPYVCFVFVPRGSVLPLGVKTRDPCRGQVLTYVQLAPP